MRWLLLVRDFEMGLDGKGMSRRKSGQQGKYTWLGIIFAIPHINFSHERRMRQLH